MQAALQGITVLDFSTVGPAARCSRVLADYGAEVVKVGAPPKRAGVQIEPPHHAYSGLRGMKRIRLDLKSDEGREVFLRLAAGADVVIESFRPGVVDRLGVGYAAVRARNEAIVYCSTSGYGQDGPRAGWAGHDLNYLAVAGFLHTGGRRADGGPPLPGATIADSAGGGLHAVVAILAALLRRGSTGKGGYLDVSVADGVLQLMSLTVDQHLATGEDIGPGHDVLTGRYACYDTYEAADGRWLAVGAIEPAFWANLCRATGLERWIPHQTDDACQDEIRADLRDVFRAKTRDAWVEELAPNDTCVAPVQTIDEVARDPQYAARGAIAEAEHALRGRFRQVAPVLAGMHRGSGPPRVEPGRIHTDEVLRAAGFAAAEIEALRDAGAVA